jgi:hypothetical protein
MFISVIALKSKEQQKLLDDVSRIKMIVQEPDPKNPPAGGFLPREERLFLLFRLDFRLRFFRHR